METYVAMSLNAKGGSGRCDGESETFVAHALRADGFDASEDGTGRGTPLVACVADTLTKSYAKTSAKAGKEVGLVNPIISRVLGCDLRNGTVDDIAQTMQAAGIGTDRGSNPNAIPHILAFSCKDHGADTDTDTAPTLRAMGHNGSHANAGGQVAVAFAIGSHAGAADGDQTNRNHSNGGPVGSNISEELAYCLRSEGPTQRIAQEWAVRRLTPLECERLQGFPDNYTAIPVRGKIAADGPRYKALGNSMAVNVMRWLGQRITFVSELAKTT